MSRVIEVVRRGPRGTDGIAGASGGLIFISSQDASASATLNFTGFDGALYDGYVFHLMNLIPATDGADLRMRTSSNGGSSYDSTANDYQWITRAYTTAAVASDTASTSLAYIALTPPTGGIGNTAGEDGVSGVVTMPGPHLAKKTPLLLDLTGWNNAGVFWQIKGSGVRNASAAVNAVSFFMSTGNITSGTITMYGLKNSV
jgi:hypothetical protein